MKNKPKILKFRLVNKDIFEAIVRGKKKIETRAATEKYRKIKVGDTVILKCGKKNLTKKVLRVEHFRSISAILKKYNPERLNPKVHTAQEAHDIWYGFPRYKEKIKKHGLIAMHLK
ncbi:MAG: hypothetical protein A3A97_01245 [Candidatus Terrybacteria bacterium RIFCSPLOWO2_01_FULL_40_23]|uniref:ASCH domain-containing protein n=1 Tax=Candidatus Terrybacteria bacterium RIFCSPLOWO2_01_FULL_40_23 TaxID=1802366 RepID=A0A1G2PQ97_9BACT|nr:MAG: hypothetical protein A3A97_01245 [Candidatus Terrybacteria bacterium RIFCSPLOWO2_01_FULL_40_23]